MLQAPEIWQCVKQYYLLPTVCVCVCKCVCVRAHVCPTHTFILPGNIHIFIEKVDIWRDFCLPAAIHAPVFPNKF